MTSIKSTGFCKKKEMVYSHGRSTVGRQAESDIKVEVGISIENLGYTSARRRAYSGARLAISSGETSGKGRSSVMLHSKLESVEFQNQFNSYLQKLKIADGIVTSESFLDIGGKQENRLHQHPLAEKWTVSLSRRCGIRYELSSSDCVWVNGEQKSANSHRTRITSSPICPSGNCRVIFNSIKNKNQLVVETHSATLIERIRRLIMMELLIGGCKIIYIQEGLKNWWIVCKQIGFLKNGNFDSPWPEDFFGERSRGTIRLVVAVSKRHRIIKRMLQKSRYFFCGSEIMRWEKIIFASSKAMRDHYRDLYDENDINMALLKQLLHHAQKRSACRAESHYLHLLKGMPQDYNNGITTTASLEKELQNCSVDWLNAKYGNSNLGYKVSI